MAKRSTRKIQAAKTTVKVADRFDPSRPYNALPQLPPAAAIETTAILKACIGARAALAGLRVACKLIPNETVLINTIPMLEARASSEIENIVTTNDALFRQATHSDMGDSPAVKEALNYRSALYHGLAAVEKKPVSTNIAVEICRIIKDTDLDIRKIPGTTLKNAATGETIYTPPEGEDQLRRLLANWERFQNAPGDLDPLIRMAVLHYQFEAIHPFVDGNGRTGRILNLLSLVQDDLLELPTLYLSRHFLHTRTDYYRLLLRVTTHAEWEPWILYVLEACRATSLWTSAKIDAVRNLMEATIEHARTNAPKIYTRELIDAIFTQPYCRIGNLVERGIAKRETASVYLKTLAGIGIFEELKAGREKLFVNRRYLDLLSSEEHRFPGYTRPR